MENTVLDTRAEHLTLLEENIREAMRHRSLDPHEDQHTVRGLIDEHLTDYEQRRTRISLPDLGDRESVIQRLHDEICGFGVIFSRSSMMRALKKSGSTLLTKSLSPVTAKVN